MSIEKLGVVSQAVANPETLIIPEIPRLQRVGDSVGNTILADSGVFGGEFITEAPAKEDQYHDGPLMTNNTTWKGEDFTEFEMSQDMQELADAAT